MMDKSKQLAKTIADDLGRAEIARAVGVGKTAVSNKVVRGMYPAQWFIAMKALAAAREYELPVAAFDFNDPEPTPAAFSDGGAGGATVSTAPADAGECVA